jgi:hypothetical protein
MANRFKRGSLVPSSIWFSQVYWCALFAETTEEEIQTKRLKLNADNTLKANKKSANILREYLKEKKSGQFI